MRDKLILLALLVLISQECAIADDLFALPAVEDVYVDFEDEQVYDTQILRCEMDLANGIWPVATLIKFDISDLEVGDDDVGILALKADSVRKGPGEGPGAIALLPTDTNWTEESEFSDLDVVVVSTLEMIENEDLMDYNKIGVRFDNGDDVFAFEISKYLKDAVGDEVSFILVAVNDDLDYKVGFMSRETGKGPYILLTPYPSAPEAKGEPGQDGQDSATEEELVAAPGSVPEAEIEAELEVEPEGSTAPGEVAEEAAEPAKMVGSTKPDTDPEPIAEEMQINTRVLTTPAITDPFA